MRNMLVLGLVVGALLLPADPSGARPQPRATFRSSTNGLPAGSEVGAWTVTGNEAKLVIGGGHGAGTTRFVGTWVTPMHHPEDGAHEFSTEGSNINQNDFERFVKKTSLRWRIPGRQWSKWSTDERGMGPGTTLWEGQTFATWTHDGPGAKPWAGPMQFQWRISGRITQPGSFEAYYTLSYS